MMHSLLIVWLSEAVTEKDDLLDYIAEYSVVTALGLNEHISRQIDQLIEFPFIGRKGRIPDTFELVISHTPYIVAYRIQGNAVQILHVFHERRNWPPK
jgi:toxin ParE1/3/4